MILKCRFRMALALALSLTPVLHAGDSAGRFGLDGISFGYEARHDRLRFEFHNPVSGGGSTLIPHRFVQTYTTDNHWGVVKGSYFLFGIPMKSEFGFTPQRTSYGDDYDTTFEPDGDVTVGGTFGNVSMRSYRFAQSAQVAKAGGVAISAVYAYRLDRARFQFGNSFETHTNPPSSVYETLPIDETTKSRFHRIGVVGRREWKLSSHWRLATEADLSPATLAWLTVILPAKYPGEELVFLAKAVEISSGLCFLHASPRFPIEIYAGYGRDWAYDAARSVRREFLALGLRLDWKHP